MPCSGSGTGRPDMARARAKPRETERLPVAERLAPSAAPWLAAARSRLADARSSGRLPHGILLHGLPGVGQSALALWAAQLALCESASEPPCGRCGGCLLFLAGNHPDFHSIDLEENASFIKVDQIRDLCGKLAMRSYRGHSKVGLIDPADKMNPNSNNALLKTLEEPPEDTVLLLVASRIDRLTPTVISRCQRIRVVTPARGDALQWLSGIQQHDDWPSLLSLAAGAPLRALELADSDAIDFAREMGAALEPDRPGAFDPLALADSWSKDHPADRLAWLEHLVQSWIRQASLGDVVNNNRDNALPSAPPRLNMKAAFELLDRVREARTLQEGPVNSLLLFEDLLVGFAEAFAGRSAVRPETQG
jgi:DNA polymerase-3 subunit delta'